jgi:aldehyde dehydrogenase (NAD+)
MLELNVSNVPHATASDDGLTLTIIFDLEDGGQARMHIPYGQYDWWIQAMQVVASAAFRKQVEAGRVTAIPNPVNANGRLSFGGGCVNLVNVHLFVETMPFGGTGSAGIGHYYGKYGFDALTHAKSMLISPPDVAIEHLYSPFTEEKNRQLAGWFEY